MPMPSRTVKERTTNVKVAGNLSGGGQRKVTQISLGIGNSQSRGLRLKRIKMPRFKFQTPPPNQSASPPPT